MALSADNKTPRHAERRQRSFGVAADEVIYVGALVAIDTSDGYLYAGATSTTQVAVGVALEHKDATGLADGELSCEVTTDCARFASAGGGDAISSDDIGATVYIVDDETVGLTDGGATRSVAGTVYQVDAGGVWIIFPGT